VIERSGARTALVVTKGTRDVYAIGRGNRPESYNVFFQKAEPFVPRHLTFEVDERRLANGDVLVDLVPEHARAVAERVRDAGVDAVAVCFLHSYAYPEHEIIMGEVLRQVLPDAYVSLSHQIVREYREYERTSTTVANAYCGRRLSEYIEKIERGLADQDFTGSFLAMQSNGGVTSPELAKRLPVSMMESGPVGGVISSAYIGAEVGYDSLISFDMGGTTAKMSLIREASPTLAHGYYVGGYASGHPVMMPVVDIVEVGAGGGSIAWIDSAGEVRIGPKSAGAFPGPICYGLGGTEPTVTDANLVLGRLNAENFLGGEMALDLEGARRGIAERLGTVGLDVTQLAAGIVKLAVASMVLAVRSVSVERGFDPRDFALVAQGGNGPLHAVEIARELAIPEVIVPPLPGVFSAVGMLIADLRHDYVRTYYTAIDEADFTEIDKISRELSEQGRTALRAEGVHDDAIRVERALELRYVGQEFVLPVSVTEEQIRTGDWLAIRSAFDATHERRFGHAATVGEAERVELVNVRVGTVGLREKPKVIQRFGSGSDPARVGNRLIWLDDPTPVECAVYARELLQASDEIVGPAVIEEHDATTLLWANDVARLTENGSLIVKVGG
jgi:N-methylhydantoinase A